MDIRILIFVLMILAQLVCLARVVREANACRWSRQARWVAWRIGGVTLGILTLTSFFFAGDIHDDALLEGVIIVGLAAMTLILVGKMADILSGMSDEEVADDLYIRQDTGMDVDD